MRQRASWAGEGATALRPAERPGHHAATLDIYAFGADLIRTGDLDPVYVALHGARLPREQLDRLLIAYFLFYHLGVAAWLSEQDDYWGWVRTAAWNHKLEPSPLSGRWPRGTERRHFRGDKCVAAVKQLSLTSPSNLIAQLEAAAPDAGKLMATVASWPMCGPWISYKAADLVDRVLGVRVDFPADLCLMYSEPAVALRQLALIKKQDEAKLYVKLSKHFSRYPAPPDLVRPCGVAETETILCKFKATLNGHYYIGKDIKEIRHGLQGWGETAATLLNAVPKLGPEKGRLF